MLKKYIPFLSLGPAANVLWAFWALKDLNEQGTPFEMLQWICVQVLVPVLFIVLLSFKRRYVYWLLLIYSGFTFLFSFGIIGWGLMSEHTPASVYAVGGVLALMGFGILYNAMKDLHWDKWEVKRYEAPIE